MATTQILLPGDAISATQIPTSQKRKIGRGLRQDGDATTTGRDGSNNFTATIGGLLEVDYRKKTASISTPDARYIPKAGDLVIAQFRTSSTDYFHMYINAHSPQAILPQLAFEGATKKTRPQLKANDLVYAKVVSAQKNMEIELSCVNPSTGKAEPDGLGPLTGGGMVFDVSPGLAERLLKKQGVVALDELGTKLPGGFEIAVGKNGKVWVECPEAGVKGVCAVGRCLREMDEKELREKEQRKLVNRIMGELERG
ncbi:exosome non-catalytic core subunit rrp40 [Exophiala xenobiotica]|nr:exosome non-catalytic core subunit rrp40 [Exophiala xenobiotica]KAK5246541.1 exosome non-catalytic core subunit rrp40 [Exophiala xenobiotica]KAK5354098.1 exosome non-catalytic core subunit rrp40 [Exophiala xenobiotica]KAK5364211.1 exosome non-catalytic core subunit rrp40 [Exophiala xenobiotica]KAK5378554.1 exosome non-catalytic core subunit rrp40 [Exophiala xenobiotica]